MMHTFMYLLSTALPCCCVFSRREPSLTYVPCFKMVRSLRIAREVRLHTAAVGTFVATSREWL